MVCRAGWENETAIINVFTNLFTSKYGKIESRGLGTREGSYFQLRSLCSLETGIHQAQHLGKDPVEKNLCTYFFVDFKAAFDYT